MAWKLINITLGGLALAAFILYIDWKNKKGLFTPKPASANVAQGLPYFDYGTWTGIYE